VSEKNALALSVGELGALAVLAVLLTGALAAVAIVFGGLSGVASEFIARSITHFRAAHPLSAQEHSG